MVEPITLSVVWTGVKICKEVKSMIDKIPNNVFIKNEHSKNIYVAVHAKFDYEWSTKHWYEVPPGQTSLIISGKLQSRYVYFHASTRKDKRMWGKGDYEEVIDGKLRKFDKFDAGDLMDRFDKGNIIDNKLVIRYSSGR